MYDYTFHGDGLLAFHHLLGGTALPLGHQKEWWSSAPALPALVEASLAYTSPGDRVLILDSGVPPLLQLRRENGAWL